MKRLLPLVLVLAACASTPEPKPTPQGPPLPTATMTGADLERVLLTPKEAQPVVAKVGLVAAKTFTDLDPAENARDEPAGCAGAVYPAQASSYVDSRRDSLYGMQFRDKFDIPRLTQVAVAFPSVSDAARQLTRLNDDLKRCADTTVTITTDDFVNTWETRAVGEIEQGMTLTSRFGGEANWTCHHAIALRANVILDVQACNDDGPDPTPNIIDAITEKMT